MSGIKRKNTLKRQVSMKAPFDRCLTLLLIFRFLSPQKPAFPVSKQYVKLTNFRRCLDRVLVQSCVYLLSPIWRMELNWISDNRSTIVTADHKRLAITLVLVKLINIPFSNYSNLEKGTENWKHMSLENKQMTFTLLIDSFKTRWTFF